MNYIYEFELFNDDNFILAFPFDFEGGTQGDSLQDVCSMAADWLQTELEHRLMHDLEIPKPTFGNTPQHADGRIVLISVQADRDTIRKMSAADAARTLGVSPGRVSQMIATHQLEAFKDGHKTWVTEDSVKARLAEAPKSGRPKKKPLESIELVGA